MRCSGCLVVLASVASGLRVPTTSGQSSVARSFVSKAPAVESRRTVLGAVGCLSGLLVSRPAQALVVDEAAASTNPLCDACVSQVRSASGQEITIVGTAHISEDSAVLVRRVIRELQPDTVMIELDPSRAGRLMQRRSTQTADADASTVAAAPPPAGGGEASKPAFGMGQVVGRIFKGDLEEASTQAVGMGLASMYRQLDSMGFQRCALPSGAQRARSLALLLLLLRERERERKGVPLTHARAGRCGVCVIRRAQRRRVCRSGGGGRSYRRRRPPRRP
jgi:hypothetical protein